MEQNRISKKINLLDSSGSVAVPGWCEHNRYVYSRSAIKAPAHRIKEWDFYQISDKRYTCQMTFADISLGGAASFALFDRETGEKFESMLLSLATFGSFRMPSDAMTPHSIERRQPGQNMSVRVTESSRYLSFHGSCSQGKTDADLELYMAPTLESLTMAVPFREKGHFYLNQKINCMPVKGSVKIGERLFEFSPDSAFAVLDWGRGVWPYKCDWYWGNGSQYMPDGKLFGFEIGWGFGIMEAFTENTLFYEGRAHKIGRIFLQNDESNIMAPWVFSSDDGRFEMTMTPEYDNFTKTRVAGLLGNICHQVFGRFNGTVTLDGGEKLEIHDMTAFCEHSDNRW